MKNRILCRLMSLGTAVLLAAGTAAGAVCGFEHPVYGLEKEDSAVTMTQSASWTEKDFCGELTVEISGLSQWLEEYKENQEPGSEEADGENSEEKSEENNTDEDKAEESAAGEEKTEDPKEEVHEPEDEIPESGKDGAQIPGEDLPDGTIPDEDGTEETPAGTEPSGDQTSETETQENGMQESGLEEDSGQVPNMQVQEQEQADLNGREADVCGSEKSRKLRADSAFRKSVQGADAKIKAAHVFPQVKENVGDSSRMPAQGAAEIPELKFMTRLSRYFRTDKDGLPNGSTAQELMLPGNDGELEKGTEIICPITADDFAQQPLVIKIPLILREEYRYSETACILPVLYRPLAKGELPDAEESGGFFYEGTCLLHTQTGNPQVLALANEEVNLEKTATPADYVLSVTTDTDAPKAGQTLAYQVTITNTGGQPLPLIAVQSSLNPSGISGSWVSQENQETDISGQKAILTDLKEGETRRLIYRAKLPEGLKEPVINTVTAQAQKTTEQENTVVRGTSLKTAVTPLKASFTVNKSADRTSAAPGDTITYQICIRNTGERTLHSVLSTERFREENVPAQFVEKEGVRLNSNKTQALISQIPPGEVFSLEAVVVVPQKLKAKELINEVLVRTEETGEKTVQSSAGVKILELSPTPQPTETPAGLYGENDTSQGSAVPVSDAPKTSDDTPLALWAGILGLAAVLGIAFGYLKLKKQRLK